MIHTFCRDLVDNEISVGYVNGASFVQQLLESLESKEYAVSQVI